ncbi:MAG TPA: hypothetical protein VNK48_12905 [Xanthobacteraceae bacterium]|nr:hypothetical protein [Xanthobacteraceae bacterium]
MDRNKAAEQPHEQAARVLKFKPRGALYARPVPQLSPVEDLRKYETDAEPDDFRHRMIMNLAGFAATIVLIVIGVWLAESMAQLRKDQDCVLAGRRDCATLRTAIPPRRDF